MEHTLTCALSKLPISTSKDSGSLVIIVMAVTRWRGKRHDDLVRETKYTSAGVLSSFSDKDLFFYQSNIAIDNVIEYFFWQLLTFVAACLSFLSSECVSVCLFSLTDLNLFNLTLLSIQAVSLYSSQKSTFASQLFASFWCEQRGHRERWRNIPVPCHVIWIDKRNFEGIRLFCGSGN